MKKLAATLLALPMLAQVGSQVQMDSNKLYTYAQCVQLVTEANRQQTDEWVEPELTDKQHVELCHKDFVRFWRINYDGKKGFWHKFNDEDKKFLADTAARIKSGQYENSKIEWFALEGKLPK